MVGRWVPDPTKWKEGSGATFHRRDNPIGDERGGKFPILYRAIQAKIFHPHVLDTFDLMTHLVNQRSEPTKRQPPYRLLVRAIHLLTLPTSDGWNSRNRNPLGAQ